MNFFFVRHSPSPESGNLPPVVIVGSWGLGLRSGWGLVGTAHCHIPTDELIIGKKKRAIINSSRLASCPALNLLSLCPGPALAPALLLISSCSAPALL